MDARTQKQFEKWGKTPPSHEPHGREEDIEKNMRKLLPNSWKMEGNLLKGMTVMGELVQNIPPNYILKGTDDKGLPIFAKVEVKDYSNK